jgi:hypothetical protein
MEEATITKPSGPEIRQFSVLLPHPEGRTLVAFHVEDHEFGSSVLHNAGMMVLNEDDLIR